MAVQVATLDILTERAHFDPEVARAIGDAIDMELKTSRETLATKQDINDLKQSINELRYEVKQDIKDLKLSFGQDLAKVKDDITRGFGEYKRHITRERPPNFDPECIFVDAPEHDLRFGQYRSSTHVDGKRAGI
jgi:hypothetical protein